MLGHAIVLIGIHVAFESIKTSSALQIIDISSLSQKSRGDEEYSDIWDGREHVHENRGFISLSSRELDELIDRVAHDVYHQNRNDYNPLQESRNKKGSVKYDDVYNLHNMNAEQLFPDQQRGKQKSHKSVWSNRGESSIDLSFDNGQTYNDENNNIYMVLNPRANINKNDFNDIIGLLSHLASESASKKIYSEHDNTRMKQEPRYKGFVIADGRRARGRNRESKEPRQQDSFEDYKPKRVRSEYGGAGGRTPIPYIRHRDIYERE